MALYHSPKTVTDGLVLYLDAANKRSYPGSGSFATDLIKNSQLNLINSVSYSTSNKGAFVFDGTSKYISVPNSDFLQFGNIFTIDAWVYPTSMSSRHGIFSTRFSNSAGSWQLEIGIANNGTNRVAVTGVGTWIFESSNNVVQTNQWHNICYVQPSNKIYINGIEISPLVTTAYSIQNNSDIKVIGSGTLNTQFFSGSISNLKFYNKSLTNLEIWKNFNTLKWRYGL